MTNRREFLILATAAGMATTASARPMGVVQTVQGPLDSARLGFTLTHEHICVSSPNLREDRPGSIAKAVDKLKEARDAGIDSIIDVSTFDVGRDIRFGEEISRKSGMQIVACTGRHLFAPESSQARSVEELTEFFIGEIERGIDDTDIKAGVIKVATRADEVTPSEEKALRAAARACKATGVPIETHTHSRRRGGERQVEIFEAEGVRPPRIALGHSDDTDDMEYLIGLAKRGYTLGMDHLFRGAAEGAMVPWQRRADAIKKLVDQGFGDRIFLSNDWVYGDAERAQENPDGLLFNTRKTIPYLKSIGVSAKAIHAITTGNPGRFWAQ